MSTEESLNEIVMLLNGITVSGVANAQRIVTIYKLLDSMRKNIAEQHDEKD